MLLANYTATKKTKFITTFTYDGNGNRIWKDKINVTGKVQATKICKKHNIIKNNF